MFKQLIARFLKKEPLTPQTIEEMSQWIDDGLDEHEKATESLKRKETEFNDKRERGAQLTKHRISL